MDETRLKKLEALMRKAVQMADELQLLTDAELFRMTQTGDGMGLCTNLKEAIRHLQLAGYNMELAHASAEGEEITGQMRIGMDHLPEATEE